MMLTSAAISVRKRARRTANFFLGCAVLTGLLAGCTPMPQTSSSGGAASRSGPNVNLSGYPQAFKDGFRDGCDSLRGSYRRDSSRFGKDNDYTLGWQDGYSICARQNR
jgi:hypothetical protein